MSRALMVLVDTFSPRAPGAVEDTPTVRFWIYFFFSGAQWQYSGASVIISLSSLLRLSHKLENNIHMFLLIGNRLGILYLF